jgi:imidazolonepropionase-like amidohydrolase
LLGSFVAAEDSPLWLGRSHFLWLEAAEQLGMDPMDALLAATRNIARAYRVDEHLGTLEEGKSADLLILERNPLEAAANYRSISLIMKEGRVIDRDGLPTQPILTSLASSGPPPEDPG